MKKLALFIVAAVALAVVCCSCGTVQPVSANEWAHDYYNQPNNTPLLEMVAADQKTGMNITMTGVKSLAVRTQLPTKNVIPQNPGTLAALGDMFGNVMPWIAGMYLFGNGNLGVGSPSTHTTTTNNYAAPAAAP